MTTQVATALDEVVAAVAAEKAAQERLAQDKAAVAPLDAEYQRQLDVANQAKAVADAMWSQIKTDELTLDEAKRQVIVKISGLFNAAGQQQPILT
jgi:hypothetical protein